MASTFSLKRPKGFTGIAVAMLLMLVAGCTSGGMLSQSARAPGTETPAADQVGDGLQVIGMLVGDEDGSLSDGVANSAYRAGKLAATTLTGTPVTLVIRRYERNASSVKKVAADLVAAGATIIIGPDDAQGAATLADLLKGKEIPILSLARGADPAAGIYAAGLSLDEEIVATIGEMQKRRHGTILIVRTGDSASAAYASALSAAAGAAGIAASEVDFTDAAAGLAQLRQLAATGKGVPNAVVFATSQGRAAPVISELRNEAAYAAIDMVGNSSWDLSQHPLPQTGPVWHPSLSGNNLASFSEKFFAANSQRPTLRSAIAYDLVIMAGALPQLAPDDPYHPEILGNEQGFKGMTGGFRFDENGVARRIYVINNIK